MELRSLHFAEGPHPILNICIVIQSYTFISLLRSLSEHNLTLTELPASAVRTTVQKKTNMA